MNKSLSRGLLIVLAGVVAVVGLSQWRLLSGLLGQIPVHSAPTPLVETISPTRVGALGRIEPASEILDIDAAAGDRVLILLAEEGQRVKQGDELAHLDGHDIAVAEKQEISSLLDEARVRTKATSEYHRALVHLSELKLKTAEIIEPIRIELQRTRVRSLEVEHQLAETEFQRIEKLHANGTVSKEEFDRKQTEQVKMHSLLIGARLNLSELEANHKLLIESAQAGLVEAKAALDVSLTAIPVRSLESKLELAEAKVQRTIIRAPIAGQVLKVLTHSGERIGKDPILKLGDTDEMHVVAEVYETDVARVRVGQRARITSSALAEPLTGSVIQIGWMIYKNDVLNVDPAADADARVVEVRIRLDDCQKVAGLTNLQVDVLIDMSETSKPNAQAIIRDNVPQSKPKE